MPDPQPPRRNRAARRDRQRLLIKHFLDGPPREPACGQAKAAARARSRSTSGPKAPKGDRTLKARARELQAETGQPYNVCLAEVRDQAARALEQAGRTECTS